MVAVRRLISLSILLLALMIFVSWLVAPMFITPAPGSLSDCSGCLDLLSYVPGGATTVVIVPGGGPTLFDLIRRLVPGEGVLESAPSPGSVAMLLGNQPAVLWSDGSNRGLIARPGSLRGLVGRLAIAGSGKSGVVWRDGVLFVGATDGQGFAPAAFARFSDVGHLFAVHDLVGFAEGVGYSVGALEGSNLLIRTAVDPPSLSSDFAATLEPVVGAMFSVSATELGSILRPLERLLPVRTDGFAGLSGQLVIYDADLKGLVPRVKGLLVAESDADPLEVINKIYPRIDGATIDAARTAGGAPIVRRDTLGIVVECARKGDFLLIGLDETSIEQWIGAEPKRIAGVAWSLEIAPAALYRALTDLDDSPTRYLLRSRTQHSLDRARAVLSPFRSARSFKISKSSDAESEVTTIVGW